MSSQSGSSIASTRTYATTVEEQGQNKTTQPIEKSNDPPPTGKLDQLLQEVIFLFFFYLF